MTRTFFFAVAVVVIFLVVILGAHSAEEALIAPGVVATDPPNGAHGVDPSLKEISVKFNQPMMDKSWSWSYQDKNKFPQMTGEPYYADGNTKCVLPVKLEPNKEYVIWVNTTKFRNFKSKAGIPAEPYKFSFSTR